MASPKAVKSADRILGAIFISLRPYSCHPDTANNEEALSRSGSAEGEECRGTLTIDPFDFDPRPSDAQQHGHQQEIGDAVPPPVVEAEVQVLVDEGEHDQMVDEVEEQCR